MKSMKKIVAVVLCALASLAAMAQKVTVSGYISDAASGEMLISAGVISEDATSGRIITGAVSNNYGFYTLSLAKGRHTLVWSFLGYADRREELDLTRDTVINVRLEPSAQLQEAVVTARKEAGLNSTNTGALEVPQTVLESMPALFGEKDVLKSLQFLPGVQGGSTGSSGIYVRGGGPDENLILLDDIPLYGVNHMFGIFSVFTPEAVKKVTLFKGSFPARYGGRLSSVIDVRTNDGNMKEFHGLVSVGMLSDRVHLEGPIIKDKTAFSVSGRVLHSFLFTPVLRAFNVPANYYFYDLNGKITHKFSNEDRLIASVYHGRDRFLVRYDDGYGYDYDAEGHSINWQENYKGNDADVIRREKTNINMDWGNTVASLRWAHAFGSKLFANTTLAYNHYEMDVDLTYIDYMKDKEIENQEKMGVTYDSGINDIDFKVDFDYNPTPEHLIKFGAEYMHHDFRPQTATLSEKETTGKEVIIDTTMNMASGGKLIGHEATLYIEDDFVIGQRLSFNPGLHIGLFYTQGKTYASVQPRFSGRVDIGAGVSVKASYARMSQYVHLLASTDISLPTDLWVPITKDIKPETADQFSLGTYWDAGRGWEFSLEGYYKNMHNILEYKDGMSVLITSTGWESKVSMGQGRAYGMELFIQKKTGNTTGWLGYTLAKSERRFPDGSINRGEWFPFKYDRRHDVSLVVNHKFSDRIDVSGSWKFFTGGVTTLTTREFAVVDINDRQHTSDYVSSRGNYRLPPSHNLCLGINFHRQKRHGERVWNISVYNAYNHMNPDFVYKEGATEFEPGTYNVKREGIEVKKITVLPVLPSFSYTRKF